MSTSSVDNELLGVAVLQLSSAFNGSSIFTGITPFVVTTRKLSSPILIRGIAPARGHTHSLLNRDHEPDAEAHCATHAPRLSIKDLCRHACSTDQELQLGETGTSEQQVKVTLRVLTLPTRATCHTSVFSSACLYSDRILDPIQDLVRHQARTTDLMRPSRIYA
jgi:hypothetical protein